MALSKVGRLRARVLIAMPIAAFLFAFQLLAVDDVRAAGKTANPHDWYDKGKCSACHDSVMPALKLDSVTVCTHCHEGYIGNHPVTKHPIGKRPEINISRRMPLDGQGKLVCYTCHDTHNRSEFPDMLRVGYLQLCSACHRGY